MRMHIQGHVRFPRPYPLVKVKKREERSIKAGYA